MESSKFFQKVWRFNAIIIALAGLLAVIVLSFALIMIAKDFYDRKTRDVQTHDVINTSKTDEIKEILELGYPEKIAHTDYLRFPLVSQQDYNLSFKDKTATSTRNLLFFNTKDNSSYWLLSSNDYLLTSQSLYIKQGNDRVINGFLYQIIKADTNNDERLTPSDKATLAVSKPDGSVYNEIIKEVDHVINVEKDGAFAYIIYNKSDKRYVATLDMQNLSLTQNSELVLPELPEK